MKNKTYQYSKKDYEIAKNNTKYSKDGKALISKDDEWINEKEWDELFKELQIKNK